MTRSVGEAMTTIATTHGPETTVDQIRAFFEDEHVHMALIVAPDGKLLTTLERADLLAVDGASRAVEQGTLQGRTDRPDNDLARATTTLRRQHKRRVAVVDDSGRLLGLLCLKRSGNGYCSDEGIESRALEAAAHVSSGVG